MAKPRNFGGRPGRKPKAGERVHLGFRVTPRTKRLLEDTAARQGRSISQEAEMRLEQSFETQEILGTPDVRILGHLFAAHFAKGGRMRGEEKQIERWTKDPECFTFAIVGALNAVLNEFPGHSDDDLRFLALAVESRVLNKIAVERFTAAKAAKRATS